MIIEMDQLFLSEVERLIEVAIEQCIQAEPSERQMIIDDSVNNTVNWLEHRDTGVHLIYQNNGQVQGMVLIKDYWNLVSLYVLPEAQSEGIGRQLANEAINRCKGRSELGKIRLNSSTFAAEFYKNMGFCQVGEPRNLPGGCIPYEYSL